ncbi:MAG TPA: polyketide cyclase / dehydrase and lipid transport [Cryptosporangiaceae bacterium]|nr:polyketide cyclase / dehydrase and lipid transport [Cryptosporangiaceae bacterium]
MPHVDLIEETWLAVAAPRVAAEVHEPGFAAALWPDLTLALHKDRGPAGLQWTVTGPLVGSCEVWLEPRGDGVTAHTFLRADVTRRGSATEAADLPRRRAVAEQARRARHAKAVWWAVKDRLEGGRRPGEPAVPA